MKLDLSNIFNEPSITLNYLKNDKISLLSLLNNNLNDLKKLLSLLII